MNIQTRLLKLEKSLLLATNNNIPPIFTLEDGESEAQAYKRLGIDKEDNRVISFIGFYK